MVGPDDHVKEYTVLPYRTKRIGENFFVSNDSGSWVLLTSEQFKILRSHRLERDSSLFSLLLNSGLIVTYDNLDRAAELLRERLWFLNNGASLHVLAVTNQCNFSCKYCYASADNAKAMDLETADKVVNFIMQSPAPSLVVEFSGGEPLLNFPAIKRVVERSEAAAEKNGKKVNFSMIHNGSNWDEEKMNFFIDHRIGVCFSLDGPPDLHNYHRPYRGGGGTYNSVVEWISRFRKEGYRSLNALPVITRKSLSRGREIVDEYLANGFRLIRFKYIGYFGRATESWDELGYSPGEYLEAWKDVVEYIYQLNRRGILVIEEMAHIMAEKLFLRKDPGYCELQMPCGAGINQLAYSPEGDVHTCDEGRMFEEFRLGTVDEPYTEIMKKELLKGMVVSSSGLNDLCESCGFKPFCGVCPVESYNSRGDIEGRAPVDRRCKLHGSMLEHLVSRISEEPEFEAMIKRWVHRGSDRYPGSGMYV